jgi:aspartyl-tRNA(Asn)/glutamyl-tRNA(Gln) amidotransferase subunit C
MAIDRETVRRIAFLARIKVAEEELAPLARELSGILGWIERLQRVDTDGVEPMAGAVEATLPKREDVVTDGGLRDDVLANAPAAEGGYFTVPKVVE